MNDMRGNPVSANAWRAAFAWCLGLLLVLAPLAYLLSFWDAEISASVIDRSRSIGELAHVYGRRPASVLIVLSVIWLSIPSLRSRSKFWNVTAASIPIQFLLQGFVLTPLLKQTVRRTRPDIGLDVNAGLSFTTRSAGLIDYSFPSGHVAATMCLMPCILFLWRSKRRGLAAMLGVPSFVWAASVAWGRVVYGAHYPSDVLFSIGLGIALAPVSLCLTEEGTGRLARFKDRHSD